MSDDRRQVLVISASNMLETSHMLKSQNLVGPPFFKLSPLTGLGNIFYLRLSLLGPRIWTYVKPLPTNITSKVSWKTPLAPGPLQNIFILPGLLYPHEPTTTPFLFQCHDRDFRPGCPSYWNIRFIIWRFLKTECNNIWRKGASLAKKIFNSMLCPNIYPYYSAMNGRCSSTFHGTERNGAIIQIWVK